jgi:hypothetical protein
MIEKHVEAVIFIPAVSEPTDICTVYRFPRLLTAFISESRFELPMALVTKASREIKFVQNYAVSY